MKRFQWVIPLACFLVSGTCAALLAINSRNALPILYWSALLWNIGAAILGFVNLIRSLMARRAQ